MYSYSFVASDRHIDQTRMRARLSRIPVAVQCVLPTYMYLRIPSNSAASCSSNGHSKRPVTAGDLPCRVRVAVVMTSYSTRTYIVSQTGTSPTHRHINSEHRGQCENYYLCIIVLQTAASCVHSHRFVPFTLGV